MDAPRERYYELFDVAAIPMSRCPMAIAPDSSDIQDAMTFEEDYATLTFVGGK